MMSLPDLYLNQDWLVAIFLILWAAFLALRSRKVSISRIAGPPRTSWLLGNLPELLRAPAQTLIIEWQEKFGLAYRLPAAFGQERLVVADPKALQMVFSSSTTFSRPTKPLWRLYLGDGLVLAEGDSHKRQRRVMNPAFAIGPLKALVPIFSQVATRLSAQLKNVIENSDERTAAVINLAPWLSRATVDSIGEAAFDYPLDMLNDGKNELSQVFSGLLLAGESQPSNAIILIRELVLNLPGSIAYAILKYLPTAGSRKIRKAQNISTKVANTLIDDKVAAYLRGGAMAKDLMAFMVAANQSETAKNRMTSDELMAQMWTLIVAAHDTTANTLDWALYALSRNPEIQSKLRAEIVATRARSLQRGEAELSYKDYEAMSYLNAVIKEVLRCYSPVQSLDRMAEADTAIPLSRPIITREGKPITEIPVGKGQFILASISGYNLSKELWGSDSMEFRPERWLDDGRETKGPQVGMFSNLMTFGTGPKGCIGWRFGLIEMQVVLVELFSAFEFSIPKDAKPVRAELAIGTIPVVDNEQEKGSQMLLEVKPVISS